MEDQLHVDPVSLPGAAAAAPAASSSSLESDGWLMGHSVPLTATGQDLYLGGSSYPPAFNAAYYGQPMMGGMTAHLVASTHAAHGHQAQAAPPPLSHMFGVYDAAYLPYSNVAASMAPMTLDEVTMTSAVEVANAYFSVAPVPSSLAPPAFGGRHDVDEPAGRPDLADGRIEFYRVQFKNGRLGTYFVEDPTDVSYEPGSLVIVEADRGRDLGRVVGAWRCRAAIASAPEPWEEGERERIIVFAACESAGD